MDQQLFFLARDKVMNGGGTKSGIGTLGEKTLHAVLKEYFEPDPQKQEVKIGAYVADIAGDQGIIEIQTRDFQRLGNKLKAFLADYPVTVVYPVAYLKWLIWLDPLTGEVGKRRKSPKTARPAEILPELSRIRQYLDHPNLKISIIMLALEEYRFLNGWSADKKRGSTRHERIPLEIFEEIYIDCPEDYRRLLPQELPEEFTSKDFAKATRLSPKKSQIALKLLNDFNVVRREGKIGKLYLYRIPNLKV